jgi:hypothetical protein
MEADGKIGFGQIAAIAAIAWVGYVVFKNRSLTLGMADIKNQLNGLETKVKGIVQGGNTAPAAQSSPTPTSTDNTVYAASGNYPAPDSWNGFVPQETGVITIDPVLNMPSALQKFDVNSAKRYPTYIVYGQQ